MRLQAVMVRKHGSKTWEPMCGPDKPVHEQEPVIRGIRGGGRVHKDFAEVVVLEVGAHMKFISPAEDKAQKDAIAKQEQEHKKLTEAAKLKK